MSTTRDIQFEVEFIKPQADSIFVVGRCRGDTIVLGDRFRVVYEQDRSRRPVELLNGQDVDLFVAFIEPWGRGTPTGCDWDSVDPGFPARLELGGQGGERLKPHCVLSNESQGV